MSQSKGHYSESYSSAGGDCASQRTPASKGCYSIKPASHCAEQQTGFTISDAIDHSDFAQDPIEIG